MGEFASSSGWELNGTVRSWISLESSKLEFGDRCNHAGPVLTRKIRAKAHAKLSRLEAKSVPEIADVRAEPVIGTSDEFNVLIAPHSEIPVGPFRFEVQLDAVGLDGVSHPCASIDASGEMQPTALVFPRTILLGERRLMERAEAVITLRLPSTNWRIDRIETDSADIVATAGEPDPYGAIQLNVTQAIMHRGDQVSQIQIVICKSNKENESVNVRVQYYGQPGKP